MADRADNVSPGDGRHGNEWVSAISDVQGDYAGVPARALAAAEHHGPESMGKE